MDGDGYWFCVTYHPHDHALCTFCDEPSCATAFSSEWQRGRPHCETHVGQALNASFVALRDRLHGRVAA